MHATHAFLSEAIDYAGTFPPASLDLQQTVERFASYREGASAWALGRLVLSAAHALEFAKRWPDLAREWPLAVVVRGDPAATLAELVQQDLRIACFECAPLATAQIPVVLRAVPSSIPVYVEVDPRSALSESFLAIKDAGARAKLRTGGTTADAIPDTTTVARWLACAQQHEVALKCTAGLHHALPGTYPLTYEPGSPRARMHGFVNVFLTAALLRAGGDEPSAVALLNDTSPSHFNFADEHIRWKDWTVSRADIMCVRQAAMVSFGSCSFTEPLDTMRAAGFSL